MSASDVPRGAGWAAGRPHASLLVCLACATVQLIAWPILFLLGIRYGFSLTGLVLVNLATVLWFLLPLGAVHGLYIGVGRGGAHGGGRDGVRVAGVVANALYLLFGILLWIGRLSGRI
jgi:hypothetical protein